LLSLFFLLLAFFIVLNSLSQRDAEKERIAAASVGQVFGESEGTASASTGEDDDSQAATGILKGLASYFGSLIPADQQKVIISTNQLIIRLPSALFFRDGGEMLTEQTPAILRQINETLDRRPADWGCELDIEIAAAEPGEREIAQAGQLAKVLRSTPARRDNEFGVSLINGDPAWLTIIIRLRQPDLPALPGAQESGQSGQPEQVAP
jgi:flagellar motor protein MotB